MTDFSPAASQAVFPAWVPVAAQHYIAHTEAGHSIRYLAKSAGCHASTVMRQVRRIEGKRDDPLVDGALARLAVPRNRSAQLNRTLRSIGDHMTQTIRPPISAPDDATVQREARRILRRLSEPAACLAVAVDMEKAVVVREGPDKNTTRTAVVDRSLAQVMALKDWISCDEPGRISRYRITAVGRAALKQFLQEDQTNKTGFAEAAAGFAPHGGTSDNILNAQPDVHPIGQASYSSSESPVAAMARRKDKAGKPFLSPELVSVAERLREDFEVAQIASSLSQNWDQLLSAMLSEHPDDETPNTGKSSARDRVSEALRDLGPGLADVVLRVCCFLEGLETAEKRMGWSARSGKVVLRIALQRLKRHYETTGSTMIG